MGLHLTPQNKIKALREKKTIILHHATQNMNTILNFIILSSQQQEGLDFLSLVIRQLYRYRNSVDLVFTKTWLRHSAGITGGERKSYCVWNDD